MFIASPLLFVNPKIIKLSSINLKDLIQKNSICCIKWRFRIIIADRLAGLLSYFSFERTLQTLAYSTNPQESLVNSALKRYD